MSLNRVPLPPSVVGTCVAAWLQAALGSDESRRIVVLDESRRMVVLDESWRMFSHLAIASGMQQSFKLSRASGTMNVLVMHRLSDLTTAGVDISAPLRVVDLRPVYDSPALPVVLTCCAAGL